MALGTAEATPLEVAGIHDVRQSRRPRHADADHKIARGDGRRSRAAPDRKNVVRPDVAYIMDDIMKDVINRGTAAQPRLGISGTSRQDRIRG